jgi:hypothetical protein
LKNPSGPLNNIERGSNIFVTSNLKQNKEEDSLNVSKLGQLYYNNENKNNEQKEESLLHQKRLNESNTQSNFNDIPMKKSKME